MDWKEMRPYHKGKDSQGNEMFSVPLPRDEDGMVGRECPQDECEPRYFKIASGDEQSSAQLPSGSPKEEIDVTLYCPYCGYKAGMQKFVTREQMEWLKSMIIRDMYGTIQNSMKKAFGFNRSIGEGPISFRLTYKPGALPSVRHYAEKKLKRIVICDECGSRYAVFGIATYCPRCRKGNLGVHLQRSVEIIKTLLSVKSEVEVQGGHEAGYYLLGNCLEDCVSLFEGFLRVIYLQALRKTASDEVRHQRLLDLRNAFQNLVRAENIIRSDLGWELFHGVSACDREFMELQFAKRHVITHNLGLVDVRYQNQAHSWQQAGQDIEMKTDDVTKLLVLVEALLQIAISCLEKL